MLPYNHGNILTGTTGYPTMSHGSSLGIQPSQGIIYVSTGQENRELAINSIISLRKFYEGSIRLVTSDGPSFYDEKLAIDVVHVPLPLFLSNNPFQSRWLKTQFWRYGYRRMIYVDSDTVFRRPIDGLWALLESHDMFLCEDNLKLDEWRALSSNELTYMKSKGLMQATHYNSGVMALNLTDVTIRFCVLWHEEWKRFLHKDQAALIRALWRSSMSPNMLPFRYNWMKRYRADDAVILHFCGIHRKRKLKDYILMKDKVTKCALINDVTSDQTVR
jgi:Glycosyl transferase family 8